MENVLEENDDYREKEAHNDGLHLFFMNQNGGTRLSHPCNEITEISEIDDLDDSL